jgi:hypothetical protein
MLFVVGCKPIYNAPNANKVCKVSYIKRVNKTYVKVVYFKDGVLIKEIRHKYDARERN